MSHTPIMADQQQQKKIHPVDVEAPPPPSAPLVPRDMSRSDKGDPAANERYPPYQRTMPVVYSPPPKRRGCCCKCICWTLLILIVLVVAVAATVGILYLVFDPKVPKYSVDKLHITDFTVDSGLNARASFDVTVTANNPNKHIGIYYEDGSELSVWYSDISLCSGQLGQSLNHQIPDDSNRHQDAGNTINFAHRLQQFGQMQHQHRMYAKSRLQSHNSPSSQLTQGFQRLDISHESSPIPDINQPST